MPADTTTLAQALAQRPASGPGTADAARSGLAEALAGQGAELRAWNPSWRDRLSWAAGNAAGLFGIGRYGQQDVADRVGDVVDFIPGVGDALAVNDAWRDFGAGNYGGAALGAGLAAVGLVPGVGDALAAGGRKLAMDQASRLARMKEGRFHAEMPLYHGSDVSFPAFDPAKAGATTGAAPSRLGAWSATDPETAEEFADLAAKSHGGNPQVYPLVHRAERPAVVDLDGTEMNHEIAATLADAFDNGYDAVMLRNYTTPGGKTGKNIVVVRDPNQLRSPWARFDPARKDSRDLLASLVMGIPTAAGGFAISGALRDGDRPGDS